MHNLRGQYGSDLVTKLVYFAEILGMKDKIFFDFIYRFFIAEEPEGKMVLPVSFLA